jgi:hypothetical protein
LKSLFLPEKPVLINKSWVVQTLGHREKMQKNQIPNMFIRKSIQLSKIIVRQTEIPSKETSTYTGRFFCWRACQEYNIFNAHMHGEKWAAWRHQRRQP